jgi:hypothetical protein
MMEALIVGVALQRSDPFPGGRGAVVAGNNHLDSRVRPWSGHTRYGPARAGIPRRSEWLEGSFRPASTMGRQGAACHWTVRSVRGADG